MKLNNIGTKSDSYKSGSHYNMYQRGVAVINDYGEMRPGGKYPETVVFGLQPILMDDFEGVVMDDERLETAKRVVESNTGPGSFNEAGWRDIIDNHGGKLPLEIAALPEGSVVPEGSVMFTVRNTDPAHGWLVGHIEPVISKVWYPSTVATVGRALKKEYTRYRKMTTGSDEGVNFQLHDFGYRGVSSEQSAEIGGMAHLVHFDGTDTVPALLAAEHYYDAQLGTFGFSVPASEHSVMTSLGREGEATIVDQLIDQFLIEKQCPILSVVIDSYDAHVFVKDYVCRRFREKILSTNGTFVLRPDSPTPLYPDAGDQVVWIYNELWKAFGGTVTPQNYKLLDSHVGILWGDGIDDDGIRDMLAKVDGAGFATTFVNGMGGGRLQKVNRDTQRFAVKCSAQLRDGVWYDIQKQPLDKTKWSKTGLFDDLGLPVVFRNGEIVTRYNWTDVRKLANEGI